jgi:hypothetical protein
VEEVFELRRYIDDGRSKGLNLSSSVEEEALVLVIGAGGVKDRLE